MKLTLAPPAPPAPPPAAPPAGPPGTASLKSILVIEVACPEMRRPSPPPKLILSVDKSMLTLVVIFEALERMVPPLSDR
ncbi:MAG: hypothetical protein EBZ75_08535 [Oxalobacteraceae bacterium]|nr:hypothetical protein [Oxalobacteraceae bacterium]